MHNLKHQAHVPNCVSFEIPVSRAHYSNDNEVSLKVAICIFFSFLAEIPPVLTVIKTS